MSDGTPAKPSGPWLNDKSYNFLKFIAQILLPALGTLYVAIAGFWGLPAVEQVMGTVVAVDTFLGLLLGISSAQFNSLTPAFAGRLLVQQHDDTSGTVNIELTSHPSEFADKKAVTFQVVDAPQAVDVTPGNLPPTL